MNNLTNGMVFLNDLFKDGIKETIPVAINSALEIGLQDERIAKILYGLGATILGFQLIKSSLPAGSLKQKKFSNHDHKPNTQRTQVQWTLVALGIAAIAYGIYSLTKGALEFQRAEEMVIHKAFQDHASTKLSSKNALKDCATRVTAAKKQFLACPEGKTLWDQLQAKGGVKLSCVSEDKAPGGAVTLAVAREIHFSEKKQDILEALAFEANNLFLSENFLALNLAKCSMPMNEFSKKVETLEGKSSLQTYHLMKKCVSSGHFSNSLMKYFAEYEGGIPNVDWNKIESYLESQERLGHTEQYRQMWQRSCGKKAPDSLNQRQKDEL